MQNDTAVRTTSVYSLRVALTPGESAPAFLADLFAEVEAAGAVVTDTHSATAGGTPYVSVSYRIPSSDDDALALARRLLDATTREPREAYLHTGLGVHRRIISEFPPVAPAETAPASDDAPSVAGPRHLARMADEHICSVAAEAVAAGTAAWERDPNHPTALGCIRRDNGSAIVVVYPASEGFDLGD